MVLTNEFKCKNKKHDFGICSINLITVYYCFYIEYSGLGLCYGTGGFHFSLRKQSMMTLTYKFNMLRIVNGLTFFISLMKQLMILASQYCENYYKGLIFFLVESITLTTSHASHASQNFILVPYK